MCACKSASGMLLFLCVDLYVEIHFLELLFFVSFGQRVARECIRCWRHDDARILFLASHKHSHTVHQCALSSLLRIETLAMHCSHYSHYFVLLAQCCKSDAVYSLSTDRRCK